MTQGIADIMDVTVGNLTPDQRMLVVDAARVTEHMGLRKDIDNVISRLSALQDHVNRMTARLTNYGTGALVTETDVAALKAAGKTRLDGEIVPLLQQIEAQMTAAVEPAPTPPPADTVPGDTVGGGV